MELAIAVTLRHLLSFRPQNKLPNSPRQMLEADLGRLLSKPIPHYFAVPPGLGLEAVLRDVYELYSTLKYLYTGQGTKLYITGKRQPGTSLAWLEIVSGDHETISINADGSLACLLPDLPDQISSAWPQRKFYPHPDLIAWMASKLWNFSGLREGQTEIISRILAGKSTLGILPTGAGKSLCFQLPAMLLPGIALVVSPLKSLMRDQFTNLAKAGIRGVDYIDSSKSAEEKERVLARLKAGQLKLLYLSPERLQIESFQQELTETLASFPISLVAIDEAHCISEWGHDFRPSYLRLRHFISQIQHPPICALTATASRYVREDILNLLGLTSQDMITPQTLDRREISLQVLALDRDINHHQAIAETIQTRIPGILDKDIDSIHQQGAGVVFAPYARPKGRHTRPLGTEAIASYLQDYGLECKHYHSQLPDAARIDIQDQFKENSFPLLVATKGYGMGIDKVNIDYIVHACAPASLEAYYQEAGRAGRDGEHAHSVIISRPRLDKCEEKAAPLPPCNLGWKCDFTGGDKCDYGIQAGLLALEYPSEQETARRFSLFLERLSRLAAGRSQSFKYICPARESARQQKYLFYLQQLGAVEDFRVLEYRHVDTAHFDLLIQVELSGPDSLENKYWLANKIVERIETYKAQKLNMLATVQTYIKTDTCRRRFLMQYFGDRTRYKQCNFCDIEGISLEYAPDSIAASSQEDFLLRLEQVLAGQSFPPCIELAEMAYELGMVDDIRVRSLRELEDNPYNPAALFLAGYPSLDKPETAAYGIRNLRGVVEALEASQDLEQFFSYLAGARPAVAYALAQHYLDRLNPEVLQALAAKLVPPEQYPTVHLALLLPLLMELNTFINTEVRSIEQQHPPIHPS